jgi:signal transduction histidine kinase
VDLALPAPGFPQTLPGGRTWRPFLEATRQGGVHSGPVAWPTAGQLAEATGVATADRAAVLVALGGARPDLVQEVAQFLPLLAATFRAERAAAVAAAQARVDQLAAAEAGALAGALDAARRELDRALRARADFLAAASHDLRNPLASIKGIAQILQRRVRRGSGVDPERLVASLETIESAVTQMAGLLDQIMDMARSEMGQPMVLERRETNLVDIARMAAAEYQQTTEQHTIRVDAQDEHVVGFWDAARLERVVGNLLSNAIKYSPAGGPVTVHVATCEEARGLVAVLEVRDEGIGIPAGDGARIFERFQRGENVIGRIAGTGIGLAACRQIVEQHGGSITAASAEGKGSTFTVRLPLAATRSVRRSSA